MVEEELYIYAEATSARAGATSTYAEVKSTHAEVERCMLVAGKGYTLAEGTAYVAGG
jgi:hypothetical protein